MSEAQLRAVLGEIEARAVSSQRELSLVNAHLQQLTRHLRLLELTSTELGALPDTTHVYVGVGKMFLMNDLGSVKTRLNEDRKGKEMEKEGVEKKFAYLEKTYENAKMHIQAAMGGPLVQS